MNAPARWLRITIAPLVLYGTWIGMMAVHELGHMLHAWASGGRVARVTIPPIGFSQTIVWPNPHERFVVWGGPLWGALLPLLACGVVKLLRRRRDRVPDLLKFFAGFCLIANGAYIGIGWTRRAGDAGDLLRLATPRWLMIAFGVVCVAVGFAIWHRVTWLTIRSTASRSSTE